MHVVTTERTVALTGHLDGRSLATVRTALYDHIARFPDRNLVVDVTGVESLDATAFRMLAACALRLERTGLRVVLCGCSPSLRRVITFTGCRRLFRFEPAVEA